MIQVTNVTKKFKNYVALDNITCTIDDNCIYGLVGSNGAGKSTLMRIIAGVYKPDAGTATYNGKPIWENPEVKRKILYVSDEVYAPIGSTINSLAETYSSLYPNYDKEKLHRFAKELNLNPKKSLSQFSKGMRRQAITILSLCANPNMIYFDETFDGLDPVIRNYIKKLIVNEMQSRNSTAIITSHSLRELEDTCDQLALLHKGGLVLESDISHIKTSKFKVQIALSMDFNESTFEKLNIVNFKKSGTVANFIVSGDREQTEDYLRSFSPLLLDILPLSLDEFFTMEMDRLGYNFDIEEINQIEEQIDESKGKTKKNIKIGGNKK